MSDYLIFGACPCVLNHFSPVWLFATLWTVARQAPLVHRILQARILEWVAMPSSRGSWRRLNSWIKPLSVTFPALAGGFFTTSATWKNGYISWLLSCLFGTVPQSYLRPCLLRLKSSVYLPNKTILNFEAVHFFSWYEYRYLFNMGFVSECVICWCFFPLEIWATLFNQEEGTGFHST